MKSARLITPEHLQGIGEIIVVWARLEAHMLRALRALLKIKWSNALSLFWHTDYQHRRDRIINLVYIRYRQKDAAPRREFDTIVKRLDAAHKIRNIVAHTIW
jgi:hypothetical protein